MGCQELRGIATRARRVFGIKEGSLRAREDRLRLPWFGDRLGSRRRCPSRGVIAVASQREVGTSSLLPDPGSLDQEQSY